MRIHHVQLAIPAGSEDLCRAFYCGILGWPELVKPAALAARGGLWLKAGEDELHLGVEADFRPAAKAHPAFLVGDVEALASTFAASGHAVAWDDAIPAFRRFYVGDAVGNRLEFLQETGSSSTGSAPNQAR